jgi:hypothetical protein
MEASLRQRDAFGRDLRDLGLFSGTKPSFEARGVEQMPPACGSLRKVDALDEGEVNVELSQGVHPMGAVEDQVETFAGGDDDRISLHAISPYVLLYAAQANWVVSFMEDEPRELD